MSSRCRYVTSRAGSQLSLNYRRVNVFSIAPSASREILTDQKWLGREGAPQGKEILVGGCPIDWKGAYLMCGYVYIIGASRKDQMVKTLIR